MWPFGPKKKAEPVFEPRVLAEFDTDIPDDTIETEDDIIQYGGKAVAEAVMALLRSPTRQVTELIDLDFKGWEFTVRTGTGHFLIRSQVIEQVLLTTGDITYPFGRSPPSPEYAAFLTELDALLQSDGRFHNIRWCNGSEIMGEGPGAPTPLG